MLPHRTAPRRLLLLLLLLPLVSAAEADGSPGYAAAVTVCALVAVGWIFLLAYLHVRRGQQRRENAPGRNGLFLDAHGSPASPERQLSPGGADEEPSPQRGEYTWARGEAEAAARRALEAAAGSKAAFRRLFGPASPAAALAAARLTRAQLSAVRRELRSEPRLGDALLRAAAEFAAAPARDWAECTAALSAPAAALAAAAFLSLCSAREVAALCEEAAGGRAGRGGAKRAAFLAEVARAREVWAERFSSRGMAALLRTLRDGSGAADAHFVAAFGAAVRALGEEEAEEGGEEEAAEAEEEEEEGPRPLRAAEEGRRSRRRYVKAEEEEAEVEQVEEQEAEEKEDYEPPPLKAAEEGRGRRARRRYVEEEAEEPAEEAEEAEASPSPPPPPTRRKERRRRD